MTQPLADPTAERVALWRALHLEVDGAPPVLADDRALALAAPAEGWRQRPDMHPQGTAPMRASIVARARLVEDTLAGLAARGVDQAVLLGAGLDTTAWRRPDLAQRLRIFEVDAPGPQAWKRQRLAELGWPPPPGLSFVPVDFEEEAWRTALDRAGFDGARPAAVASTGVSLYLSADANEATLRAAAGLAPGSTLVFSFLVAAELLPEADRALLERSARGAAASGTPFRSLFVPEALADLARTCGFREARIVTAADLEARHFRGRADGLKPSMGEALLVAST